mmetsp:Transcript_5669/g.16011  ORF Transcript_5669/g.16011 Transcript_5669/m.16011 type:complete len:201 (+) Transcript_5669:476-1078(+)
MGRARRHGPCRPRLLQRQRPRRHRGRPRRIRAAGGSGRARARRAASLHLHLQGGRLGHRRQAALHDGRPRRGEGRALAGPPPLAATACSHERRAARAGAGSGRPLHVTRRRRAAPRAPRADAGAGLGNRFAPGAAGDGRRFGLRRRPCRPLRWRLLRQPLAIPFAEEPLEQPVAESNREPLPHAAEHGGRGRSGAGSRGQ